MGIPETLEDRLPRRYGKKTGVGTGGEAYEVESGPGLPVEVRSTVYPETKVGSLSTRVGGPGSNLRRWGRVRKKRKL